MRPHRDLIGWYSRRGARRVGPLPLWEIARLLDAGELTPAEMLTEIGEQVTEAGPTVRYSYVDAATAVRQGLAADARP